MTARIVTCHELTRSETDLKKINDLFMALQTSATPAALLLAWFPSLAKRLAKEATSELFTVIYSYVEARRHAEPTCDAIDILIAEGETTQSIVEVGPVPNGA